LVQSQQGPPTPSIHNSTILSLVDHTIRNLIFDLGGVLLDLHIPKTHEALSRLAGLKAADMAEKIKHTALFDDYERGAFPDNEFRNNLRMMFHINSSDLEIDQAWNAMLGGIPMERLALLTRLRTKYKIYLLSNTNEIHRLHFEAELNNAGKSLSSYFDALYYSHLLKMRKPEPEIFRHVIRQNKLEPNLTLFLDDNLNNLAGAAETGLRTFHVQSPEEMMMLFE
jgi:glucose-1-phosphatase